MLHLTIIGDSPAVCERMTQFPSSARYVCACAVRAGGREGGRERCLNGFCCGLRIRHCLYILYVVAVKAGVEPVTHPFLQISALDSS